MTRAPRPPKFQRFPAARRESIPHEPHKSHDPLRPDASIRRRIAVRPAMSYHFSGIANRFDELSFNSSICQTARSTRLAPVPDRLRASQCNRYNTDQVATVAGCDRAYRSARSLAHRCAFTIVELVIVC